MRAAENGKTPYILFHVPRRNIAKMQTNKNEVAAD